MAKALRGLIIVLLVLSVVSLVLGMVLFSQRGEIKGRTQTLEQAAVKFAESIRYQNLVRDQLKDPKAMDAALSQLSVAADNQYTELQDTKTDLANTRQDLENTKMELATTKTDLEGAKVQVAEMTEKVAQKDAELAQANGRVTQLEQDKANLQVQIDDLNNQMVKAEEESRDLQDQVATLDKIIKDMEREQGAQNIRMPAGLSGHVLVVNPDWNFVILDIGSEAGLVPTAEMLVHRADELVGKVRISTVKDNLAIAEIITDWEKAPIQEGDRVLF
ncbi:MAG: hypothetical protein V2A34_07335 [Lentisphaerota bacterium]